MIMKRLISKIFLILSIALVCCIFFDYTNSEIINFSFIFSSSIDILAVALAVTAIFFTVIDRYKSKQEHPESIEKLCLPILKEMCDNVLGILFAVIAMFSVSILEGFLDDLSFPKFMGNFSISCFIYLAGFIFILAILYDITKSILNLTCGLFVSNNKNISNEKYTYLMEICRKLDQEHFNELLNYVKTLIVKQELEKNKK